MTDQQKCLHCGSPFTPETRGGRPKVYCSAKCRVDAASKRKREARAVVRPTECAECGGPINRLGNGRPRRFCSELCKARAGNRRARRARLPLKNPTEKVCAHCGDTFTAKSRDRIYCYGKFCAQAAYAKRRGQGVRRVGAHEVTCDECGKTFTSVRPEARWCSKLCANRHWGRVRSRQRKAPSAAHYTDREIFQRDGWVCQICGEPVNRDADRLDPDGPTIDHVIPIAVGGVDEPHNLATAHWRCNRDKGAKT